MGQPSLLGRQGSNGGNIFGTVLENIVVSRTYSTTAELSFQMPGGMRGAASTSPQQPPSLLVNEKTQDLLVHPLKIFCCSNGLKVT